MDIHKPKAWRGFREFLKEYLIIVVGVLTALAAEQGVEALRWAERTDKTEAHLRAELADATVAAQAHIAQEPCEYAMLARLQQALLQPGEDWKPPYVISRSNSVPFAVIAAPIGGFQSPGWRNAQADGTANHLGQAEQMRFGGVYTLLAQAEAANDAEHSAMSELNSLAWARRLDPTSRTEYLRLISRLFENARYMATTSRLILQQTAEMGVKRKTLEDYGPSLKVYRGICDQFRAGKSVIIPVVPATGA